MSIKRGFRPTRRYKMNVDQIIPLRNKYMHNKCSYYQNFIKNLNFKLGFYYLCQHK